MKCAIGWSLHFAHVCGFGVGLVCIHMYVYIYRERQTDRERETESERDIMIEKMVPIYIYLCFLYGGMELTFKGQQTQDISETSWIGMGRWDLCNEGWRITHQSIVPKNERITEFVSCPVFCYLLLVRFYVCLGYVWCYVAFCCWVNFRFLHVPFFFMHAGSWMYMGPLFILTVSSVLKWLRSF